MQHLDTFCGHCAFTNAMNLQKEQIKAFRPGIDEMEDGDVIILSH